MYVHMYVHFHILPVVYIYICVTCMYICIYVCFAIHTHVFIIVATLSLRFYLSCHQGYMKLFSNSNCINASVAALIVEMANKPRFIHGKAATLISLVRHADVCVLP